VLCSCNRLLCADLVFRRDVNVCCAKCFVWTHSKSVTHRVRYCFPTCYRQHDFIIFFSVRKTDYIMLKFKVLSFNMLIFLSLYITHACLQTKQRQHNSLMTTSRPVFSRIFLHASCRPFNCSRLSYQQRKSVCKYIMTLGNYGHWALSPVVKRSKHAANISSYFHLPPRGRRDYGAVPPLPYTSFMVWCSVNPLMPSG
jgi:hypothetical protein